MKKMMLGMVALAAGAAMAIESANVVGYSQTPACGGYSVGTAQFIATDGTQQFALTSVRPVAEGASDCISLSVIDEEGYANGTFVWAEWSAAETGWVNDDMEFIDDSVVFDAGTAFWIQNDVGEEVGLQSAGSVCGDDANIPLTVGYSVVGNPFPVSVKLVDMLAQGDSVSDCVSLSTIDQDGYVASTYVWAAWSPAETGWVDDNMEFVDETVVIGAGAAFWTQCDAEGATLYIPAPEL